MESKEELKSVEDSILFKKNNPVNGSEKQLELFFKEMKKFFEFINGIRKTRDILDDENKNYYNVYVYKELPYPPNSNFQKKTF